MNSSCWLLVGGAAILMTVSLFAPNIEAHVLSLSGAGVCGFFAIVEYLDTIK